MATSLQVQTTYRQILSIAVPISFALLVPQLNFVTNNIFLGHLSGEALAIASITGVYYLIFTGIGYGLNNGLQSLISRRAGENKPHEIGIIFNQGIWIALLIALAAILLTYFVAPFFLHLSIHSPVVYTKAISFLRIRILGLPFLFIYQMRNALLIGTNQSKYLVTGTIAETLCNVFFDYVLIFGKWGFPQLGFNGAAIASIIAEFAGMFTVFLVIHYAGITKRFALFQHLKWNNYNAKLILNLSGPLIFQHAISVISWLFFYVLIEHHGQMSLGISNIMRNIFGLCGVFTWAFAATSNSMISNIIGQGRPELIIPVIKKIMGLSTGLVVTVSLLLNIFPHSLLSIYGQGTEFIQSSIPVLRVVAFAMIIMSMATVWLYAVTGTGNSRITFLIEVAALVLYCIYVYVVLEIKQLSIVWGWVSEILYWSTLLSLSYYYIRSNRWQFKKLY